MDKPKYNLTFWQRLTLIPIWFTWHSMDPKERKSWHLVKKGMEKHEHKFIIPGSERFEGEEYKYMGCDHEGCNLIELIDLNQNNKF